MAHGKLASSGDVHSDFARHRVIRMQGTRWYFRTLDGHRSDLWAHGGYYREGTVQVRRAVFLRRSVPNFSGRKGIPNVRYLRRLPTRCPVHNPRDLCISRRRGRFEVGRSRCLFPSSLLTELVAQWRHENHCYGCGHHV